MNNDDIINTDYESKESIIKPPEGNEKTLAALLYGISLFFPIIGPLVIWLIKKDESDFLNFHGLEYFNFFISIFIYSSISGLLTIILIGFIGLAMISIFTLVFTIIAAVKAYDGEYYKIPYTIRFFNK